jgi:hypothetical protein
MRGKLKLANSFANARNAAMTLAAQLAAVAQNAESLLFSLHLIGEL